MIPFGVHLVRPPSRAHLFQLLKDMASGADVIIAKSVKPMARMSALVTFGEINRMVMDTISEYCGKV
jgi:hypothetical protein